MKLGLEERTSFIQRKRAVSSVSPSPRQTSNCVKHQLIQTLRKKIGSLLASTSLCLTPVGEVLRAAAWKASSRFPLTVQIASKPGTRVFFPTVESEETKKVTALSRTGKSHEQRRCKSPVRKDCHLIFKVVSIYLPLDGERLGEFA